MATARSLVKQFATTLKSELTDAIQTGGLPNAVDVCHLRAPQIAAELGEQSEWAVGRTSLRRRNPDNSADAWERKVLEDFERRKAAGEAIKNLDHAEVQITQGQSSFRYMKAIPTGAICLSCHGGDSVAPAVADAIKATYPEDQARDFNEGDIRGAFTLTKIEDIR